MDGTNEATSHPPLGARALTNAVAERPSHELGHILIDSGAHPVGTVMGSRPAAPAMRRPRFTDPQCTTLHSNA